jgi:predicted nucleotidyltransferase
MLTADGILDVLAKHRERIRSLGIRRIGVFGSFARGETTLWKSGVRETRRFRAGREESDIDILIEFEEGGRSFDTYMDLKFFLEDIFGRRVDLVDRDTIKPDLAPYILQSVRYAPEI